MDARFVIKNFTVESANKKRLWGLYDNIGKRVGVRGWGFYIEECGGLIIGSHCHRCCNTNQ